MKTKLDELLEIKADFEILETHNPENMPVNVQQERQYKPSTGCADKVEDIFAKAKKIEGKTKAKEMYEDRHKRHMPYFYC